MAKRTEIFIETHETWVSRRPVGRAPVWCFDCLSQPEMFTPEELAHVSRLNVRTICNLIEGGRVHFLETADGGLFVCPASLYVAAG